MLQTLIDNAIKKAKCPVHITIGFMLERWYPAYFHLNGDDWAVNRWNAKPEIYILKTLPLQEQLTYLYHELGHLDCFRKRCKCFVVNKVAMEFHAHRFALKHIPDKKTRLWLAQQIEIGVLGTEELRKRVLRCKAYRKIMG